MKKLMTVMLGLSMLVGTSAMFAAEKVTTKSTEKSVAKSKKKGGKKKSTVTNTAVKKS